MSWWFHDIESDEGVRVHHMVIGVILIVVAGLLLIALLSQGLWLQLVAILFSAGAALTLDEFALILRLQDVYWMKVGHLSVDAVVLVLCAVVPFFLGFRPLAGEISSDDQTDGIAYAALVTAIVVDFAFVLLCFLKGKMWTGSTCRRRRAGTRPGPGLRRRTSRLPPAASREPSSRRSPIRKASPPTRLPTDRTSAVRGHCRPTAYAFPLLTAFWDASKRRKL